MNLVSLMNLKTCLIPRGSNFSYLTSQWREIDKAPEHSMAAKHPTALAELTSLLPCKLTLPQTQLVDQHFWLVAALLNCPKDCCDIWSRSVRMPVDQSQ